MFNPQHRLKMLSVYPERYEEPQMLTTAEIEDPWIVVEEFFDRRCLSQWRMDMEMLREDLMIAGPEELPNHVYILKDTERVVEAVSVMFGRYREEAMLEAEKQNDVPGTEEHDLGQPVRRVLLFDTAVHAPWPSLSEVYRNFSSRELAGILDEWKEHGLSCNECYGDARERAVLLDFSRAMKKLQEAVYALWLVQGFESRSGIDLQRPANLQVGLLRKEAEFELSDEELEAPAAVLEQFFERYSPQNAKGELWNLTECVLRKAGVESAGNVLPAFECLMAVVAAACIILRAPGQKDAED